MKITPSESNKMRQLTKRMKRLYWQHHWTFTPRKKQFQRIMRKYWSGRWKVKKWRSLVDGTLCREDGEAVRDLMAFKERYRGNK